MINFTWWVNRKDVDGNNGFQGCFLDLDNIGIFDLTETPAMGGCLEQADGTAWKAFYAQTMLRIAIELARNDETYREYPAKFMRHYLRITYAIVDDGSRVCMGDEEDGFFYNVLRTSDGSSIRLKIRSMVGLIPLCAVQIFEQDAMQQFPELSDVLHRMQDFYSNNHTSFHDIMLEDHAGRHMMSALDEANLRRVLKIMLDPDEFL